MKSNGAAVFTAEASTASSTMGRSASLSQRPSVSSHPAAHSHRTSRVMSNRSSTTGLMREATGELVGRGGTSKDLLSNVAHFLSLYAAPSAMIAAKERRRQLLLLRDSLVDWNNRGKGDELLSQGGPGISQKVEASRDFNCCLEVILTTSLVFADEVESVARESLRSMLMTLQTAQDSGDEKQLRAAIVVVVNRILICTPLAPPTRDRNATRASHAFMRDAVPVSSLGNETFEAEPSPTDAEVALLDGCLDFLRVEEGAPVLWELVWQRWLDFFEEGYQRCAKAVLAADESEGGASRSSRVSCAYPTERSDGATPLDTRFAAGVPRLMELQCSWRPPTSAYAQFCRLLLAIFFVRTKDFSLNYLARVSKLVQYYTYQVEKEDGAAIPVTDGVAVDDVDESEEEEEVLPVRMQPSASQSRTFHEASTQMVKSSDELDSMMEAINGGNDDGPFFANAPPSASQRSAVGTGRSSRHEHQCFLTEELVGPLRPSATARVPEEGDTDRHNGDTPAVEPSVRRVDSIVLPYPSGRYAGEQNRIRAH